MMSDYDRSATTWQNQIYTLKHIRTTHVVDLVLKNNNMKNREIFYSLYKEWTGKNQRSDPISPPDEP